MCGICGYIGFKTDTSVLQAMTRSLMHRGPDDYGYWVKGGTALGHARLAIIDLTEAARQPMITQDGRYAIVFNGEIYNYREIRRELANDGEIFQSNSDTEVILLGYRKWGVDILKKLRGMFAFAIWDDYEKKLLLVRDRIGIKPLFYVKHSKGLVFGSEIKAILLHPLIEKKIYMPMVDAYLALGYVPAPDTIFAGIKVLPPAHLLLWHGGEASIQCYWEPACDPENTGADEHELVDELDKKLQSAVESHLLADVEVGAFLSGGVDSSLIAAIAVRKMNKPLKTFTIGFSGGGDERQYARIVAEHIGTEHHETMAETNLLETMPLLLKHLEQPLFDNSSLPTWLVSAEASKHVKAVLSGDGGDEPFFGYDWSRWAMSIPRLLPTVAVCDWKWAYQTGKVGLAKRFLFDVSHDANCRYMRRITTDDAFRDWLYVPEYRASLAKDPLALLYKRLSEYAGSQRFAIADLKHYLPEDVLFKVDRMSMAHGLEVRVPLLDHRLLEWVLRLPVNMRFRHGHGKYLLRKVASRYLPEEILKPRKQGFTIPIGRWLREEVGEFVREIFLSESFASRGIIQPPKALQLLIMHLSGRYELGHRIWSLVVLEMWFREWMD